MVFASEMGNLYKLPLAAAESFMSLGKEVEDTVTQPYIQALTVGEQVAANYLDAM